ncbi:MAG: DUF1573 domain-containing protein [Bacteroidota bacterium]
MSNSSDGIGTDIISNPMGPEGATEKGIAIIEFDEAEIDLGTISQGEKHDLSFAFKNTGDVPLYINAVNASCGCTVPKGWHEEAIEPGAKGKIDVSFDSSQKRGETQSEITLVANTLPSSTIVLIKANVIAPE